jgi:hypothetical protein
VPSDVNSAQVVIKRHWNPLGSAVLWSVLLDGKEVGTLRVGGALTVHVAAGEHTIVIRGDFRARGRSEPLSFAAIAGERIDLVTTLSWSGRPKVWRPSLQPSPSPPDKAVASASQMKLITEAVMEGPRYEVPLGDEERTIDNSMSASTTTRVVRLTREWARTCVVDIEHITMARGSAQVGFSVLDFKAEAERSLTKKYSLSTEERETFMEEVTLNIAAHTRSKIVFSWKQIRQKGVVQVVGTGFESRIPYEVVVGVTFDQQQIDVS